MKELYLDVLQKFGYDAIDHGRYAKFRAYWRDGNDVNSVTLYYDSGTTKDHVTGETYSFKKLLELISGAEIQDLDKFFVENKLQPIEKYNRNLTPPKIRMPKIYDKELLNNLIKDHSYFINRGISEKTLQLFGGGISKVGASKDRYVFPIFNESDDLIGFVCRDLTGKKSNKYKIFGEKGEFEYPLFLEECRQQIIDKSEIILVEGIPDALSLWECGIKNVFVLFGLDSISSINACIRFSPKKIIIATNNDSSKSTNYGLEAANKIKTRFSKFLNSNRIHINLPDKHNDLNEVLINCGHLGIIEWYNKCK